MVCRLKIEAYKFSLTSHILFPALTDILIPIYLSTVVCGSLSLDTSRGYFTWPETFPEEFAAVQCENGITRRFCSRTGVWDKPVVTDCYVSTNELFRYIEKVSIYLGAAWLGVSLWSHCVAWLHRGELQGAFVCYPATAGGK